VRIPGLLKCDLCGEIIANERRAITITVPLPDELRHAVLAEMQRVPVFGGVLNLLPVRPAPTHWTLEVCGCVIGLLPVIAERLTDAVRQSIAVRQAQIVDPQAVSRLEDL
jgi:hypothetical protein